MRLIDADALHAEISEWPESVMYKDWVQSAIANAPTIAPQPNDPLTLEELREIDDPVWVECGITAFTPDGGYYSLCKNGHITTPSGIQHIAEDIPHWKFYRRKPKEETR